MINRFIGAHYALKPFDPTHPEQVRELSIDMSDYIKNMATRFHNESGITLRKVATPYIPDDEWSKNDETPGRFAKTCASHAATSLFAARVGCPHLSNITQRLCSAVSRWTVVHDSALVRLMSFAFHNSDLTLNGALAPEDIHDVAIVPYSDADWAGDGSTTRSTTGFWLELCSMKSGRCWPISWGAILQTSTSSATAESETVAASHTLRREAFPIQILFEHLLGKRLNIRMNIDNTQAISAIQKGYSKKLRHLARTQRVCIGLLNECLKDKDMQFQIQHCPTDLMKGDIFTKALIAAKFQKALEMIQCQ